MDAFTRTVNEKGISVLFTPTNPTIDIVFVHGFTGHPERTWTLKDAKPVQPTTSTHNRDTDSPSHSERSRRSKRVRTDSFTDDKPRPSKLTRIFSSSSRRSDVSSNYPTPSRSVYWPRDLVPDTLPTARILTYGYDTNVRSRLVGPISKNTVGDHGWDLLCALADVRRHEPLRPLLFVSHSLGGLVSKIALIKSNDCRADKPHLYNILESTVGVFFFGTPHLGADPLGLARGVLTALAKGITLQLNDNVVSTLMPGGDYLRSIRDGFVTLARQRQWSIFSFQEEYGLGGLRGNKVVDDESSRIDDPSLETTRHIAKNHMEMVRFTDSADPEYQKVASALHLIYDRSQSQLRHSTSKTTVNTPSPIVIPSGTPSPPSSPDPNSKEAVEARKELMDLLYFDEIDARLLSLRPALNKTCSWFLEKKEYLDWLNFENYDSHHGFLWIKGKPGAGKSILMKFLEAKTKAFTAKTRDRLLASFFFFAPGQHLEKSTLGLYRSILWQLFEKVPDLAQVLDTFDSNARRVIRRAGWQIETLKEILALAIESLGHRELCLLIDALDECHDEDVADMVSFFEDLGETAADRNIRLRICFSSRYYPTIILRTGVEIRLDHEEEHSCDITRYINAKLNLDRSKRAGDIRQQILDKSAGIFLWVALVIPMLNKACARGRMDQLQKRLKEMPPGLDNIFDMILTRDQEDMNELRCCIQWILFAVRPLTLVEYFFALREADDSDALKCWDDNELDPEDMRRFVDSSSKGLAEVTKTRSKTKEPTVQFIHESVRDYFLLKDGKQKLWPQLEGNFVGLSHEMLKSRCLADITHSVSTGKPQQEDQGTPEYHDDRHSEGSSVNQMLAGNTLQHDGYESELLEASQGSDEEKPTPRYGFSQTVGETRPFLSYATSALLYHSDYAQRHSVVQTAFLVEQFPPLLTRWITLHNTFEKRNTRHLNDCATTIYIFAALGLENLLSVDPDLSSHNGEPHQGGGRHFNPLATAILLRNDRAARVLVSALSPDSDFAAGLEDAIASLTFQPTRIIRNEVAFFDLLVDLDNIPLMTYYIRLWSSNYYDWCRSQFFTGVRSPAMASLLLKSILDIAWTYQPVLPRIARLVEQGADPNTSGQDGKRPLHWTIERLDDNRRNSEQLNSMLMTQFETLLKYDADPNARDSLGRTPCHYLKDPFSKVIWALKGKGADVDAVDNQGRTPLFYLENPINIGYLASASMFNNLPKDHEGKTPLFFARNYALVEVLVHRGGWPNVNAVDNTGKTPLFSHKDAESMCFLIRRGADVRVQDHNGQTPLHWHLINGASFRNRGVIPWHEMARLLIFCGADLFAKDSDGKTALEYVRHKTAREVLLSESEKSKICSLTFEQRKLCPERYSHYLNSERALGVSLFHIEVYR